jgi:hypothetical protein
MTDTGDSPQPGFDVFANRADAEKVARGRIVQGALMIAAGVLISAVSYAVMREGFYAAFGLLIFGLLRVGAGARDLLKIRRGSRSGSSNASGYAVRTQTLDEPTGWQLKAQRVLFVVVGLGMLYGLVMSILGR